MRNLTALSSKAVVKYTLVSKNHFQKCVRLMILQSISWVAFLLTILRPRRSNLLKEKVFSGSCETEADTVKETVVPWWLCTVTQVEELKSPAYTHYMGFLHSLFHCLKSNEQHVCSPRQHNGPTQRPKL